jgi:hypothetical protein
VLLGERFLPAGSLGFATRPLLSPSDGAPFWGLYAMHLTLITTLIAAVLISGDGFEVPVWLYLPALAVGLVLPLIWPEIRSVPAFAYGGLSGWQQGLIDGLAGVATAIALTTAVMMWRSRSWRGGRPALGPVAVACSIGVVMGWQQFLWLWPLIIVLNVAIAAALRTIALLQPDRSAAPASQTCDALAPPARSLETPGTEVTNPETISEEVHIVSPPSEPSDPS